MSEKKSSNPSSVLYRKYRPDVWSDVIGQEHIVSVLEGSIKLNKIAHAYLFSGSRGTGKTTIARIFAKALGVTANDIYEIDAASNRGIDDIREIRSGVSAFPLESKYKVYIIDEVHMLTKEAFNALLKTLEEPPTHVIFILATTETDKIPETVLSRCQIFTFRKPNREILKILVTKVAKKEGYVLESGTAELVALLGDGSFRDTLGILQKVLSSSADKNISIKEVEDITGAPKSVFVNDFIKALLSAKKEDALSVISKVKKENISIKIFIALILEKVRLLLILKSLSKESIIKDFKQDVSEDDWVLLENLSKASDNKVNSGMLRELLKAYDATTSAYIESLPLELVVVDIL